MGKHALSSVSAFQKRGGEIYQVDPSALVRDESKNIRESYGQDEDDLALKEFIRENGLMALPPLEVQKQKDNTLLLRDGFRRHWAAMSLISEGEEIRSCLVRLVDKDMTDENAIFHALSTGQGKRPSIFEEARAILRLKNSGIPVKEIAKRLGRTEVWVYMRLKLVNASPETRQKLSEKKVSIRDAAKAIQGSGGDPARQEAAIRKAQSPKIKIGWNKKAEDFSTKNLNGWDGSEQFKEALFTLLENYGINPTSFKATFERKDDAKGNDRAGKSDLFRKTERPAEEHRGCI